MLIEELVAGEAQRGGHEKSAAHPASTSNKLAQLLEGERQRFKSASTFAKQKAARFLSLTTNGGLTVAVPPYDFVWTTGFLDDADKIAGTFDAFSVDTTGYQAAGLGLFVSSTTSENVQFSADAEFHIRWTDWALGGGQPPTGAEFGVAATDGGIGVIVFEGGNTVVRRDVHLWSDTKVGSGLQNIASDDRMMFLSQTSAGTTNFHVEPGRRYQVWIWCWTWSGVLGTALAIASIEARIPFVVVQQVR